MIYQNLILLVSECCNFNCSYCYQTKETQWMRPALARDIIDFFYPHIKDRLVIHFTGGEPLLNFPVIRSTVLYGEKKNRILKKNIGYVITTNGSLVTHDILSFLNNHHFNMELGFDGLAQEKCRKKGSYLPTLNLIRDILKYPDIQLCVSSVFTPATVNLLSDSLKEMIDLGIPRLGLCLALNQEWPHDALSTLSEEMEKCGNQIRSAIEERGHNPLEFFIQNEEPGIKCCTAGQDQLCISSTGEIWGCPLFYQYFKSRRSGHSDFQKYFFGHWTQGKKDFFARAEPIFENYRTLSRDHFHNLGTDCFPCEYLEKCEICPVLTSLDRHSLEFIPEEICKLIQILAKSRKNFFSKKNNNRTFPVE